jgi:hypothetical protein
MHFQDMQRDRNQEKKCREHMEGTNVAFWSFSARIVHEH